MVADTGSGFPLELVGSAPSLRRETWNVATPTSDFTDIACALAEEVLAPARLAGPLGALGRATHRLGY